MAEPTIADRKPVKTALTKGETYFYCTCGKSDTQPFCNGAHRGTSFTPKKFVAEETGDAFLCQCKHTKNLPYCDGSHKNLPSSSDMLATSDSGARQSSDATAEEPYVAYIHELAQHGLDNVGHHGEMAAMGVPIKTLPHWDDIQFVTAQVATQPLLETEAVGSDVVIGKRAKKPLKLSIPLFVSDMSFGALSEEAKLALAKGAEKAGTGICSGEGGMLPDEQECNSRYLYELASAKFGFDLDKLKRVQAFHFKGGQGAKTGTGGHLPGVKVKGKIAEVRKLTEGEDAISPATFEDLHTVDDFKTLANKVRDVAGGIPIGFKLSAQHIEEDIEFAVQASADYIILDGRGGGTGAAPLLFRDHISVPTIPALARARHYLDSKGYDHVSLVITGGLRTAPDFVKALAMGADAIAVSNAAMQAIGCVGARICNTNNCPVGIATQKLELRKKMKVDVGADRLARYFNATVELMAMLARACGHDHLNKLNRQDLTTWKKDMHELSGVPFGGVTSLLIKEVSC